MTENLHALSAHGPQFPGTLDLTGCSPSYRFTKFVTPDRFGIADASLSHFVSHVDIVRSTCRHVWRHLRRQPPLVPLHQDSKCSIHQMDAPSQEDNCWIRCWAAANACSAEFRLCRACTASFSRLTNLASNPLVVVMMYCRGSM